jgi:hypothetical protein
VQVTFGGALLLESISWTPEQVPAGGPLRLALRWSYLRCPEHDVRLTLKLADASGHGWAKAEPIIGRCEPGEEGTEYEGLLIPQGAPPGEYTLRLMVTDDETGEPLLAGGDKWASALSIQVTEPVNPPILYGLSDREATAFCSPDGATCVTLAGIEPGGLRFQQGHVVPFTLHWLIPDDLSSQVRFRVQVQHRPWLPVQQAAPVVTRTLALAPDDWIDVPSSDGTAGPFRVMLPIVTRLVSLSPDLVSERVSGRLATLPSALELPADAPTGRAQVTLQVLGPDGAVWPTAEGASAISLFDIIVEDRPVMRRLPAGLASIQADFGDEVGLRGYRVEGDALPGGQLHLTYAWHARVHPTAIYAVFNHLVAADGTLVAQVDGWPQEGRMLTIQWQAGEYIEDGYLLEIPADAPPGPYTLYVGLYDAATDERQPAFLDGQRLPGDRVPIPLSGEDTR